MNQALLYRRRIRSTFWIAFVGAVAIHIGAVALAKTKSPIGALEHLTPVGAVDVLYTVEPEPSSLEQLVAPPPLEEVHSDEQVFREENYPPPIPGAHRKPRIASVARGTPTASLRSVKALVTDAPRPVYPYEARRQRLTGSGVALLTVNQTSGAVTDVLMMQSCGNSILDNSTLDALRRWRFKPGIISKVQVPITYSLMGPSH